MTLVICLTNISLVSLLLFMGHRYTVQSDATEKGGMEDESCYSELKELNVGNSDSLFNQYKPGVSFIAYGT